MMPPAPPAPAPPARRPMSRGASAPSLTPPSSMGAGSPTASLTNAQYKKEVAYKEAMDRHICAMEALPQASQMHSTRGRSPTRRPWTGTSVQWKPYRKPHKCTVQEGGRLQGGHGQAHLCNGSPTASLTNAQYKREVAYKEAMDR